MENCEIHKMIQHFPKSVDVCKYCTRECILHQDIKIAREIWKERVKLFLKESKNEST